METPDFKKIFSVEEANRTLPLVKEIVKDILDISHQIRSLSTILGKESDSNLEIQNLYDDLKERFAELENLGCFYKDWNFQIGLVDFPAVIGGETVFLCWRSDEQKIGYFHRIEDGYAGRQKIPAE